MIKYKDITQYNIDDYIRDKQKIGIKKIVWEKREWDIFGNFVEAVMGCGIGLDINISAISNCIDFHNHKPKSGVVFMGIKHISNKKK